MNNPYRQPAEMPKKEEEPMSDLVRIWKMVLTAGVCLVAVITGACVYTSYDSNKTSLTKVQIESSETSRAAAISRASEAQARYLEAKAKADQAMFDQMNRAGK